MTEKTTTPDRNADHGAAARQHGIIAAVLIFLGLVIGAFGVMLALGDYTGIGIVVALLGLALLLAAIPQYRKYSAVRHRMRAGR